MQETAITHMLQDTRALSLQAEFADPDLHQVHLSGPWAIWYLPEFFNAQDALETADYLAQARIRAVEENNMPDVISIADGFYTNVYLHTPDADDGFPDEWSNGVGTNIFDLPYITFPNGAGGDLRNVAHEGFHIFQYAANSPGFGYEGDSAWYVETTAEWFAIDAVPGSDETYLTSGSIAGQPHLNLWHSFDNARDTDPVHWMTETRQYGMQLFVEYLVTETPLTGTDVLSGFFEGTSLSPQAYIAQRIGHDVMADAWADMAGWLVASFSGAQGAAMPDWLLSEAQRDRAVLERALLVESDPVAGIEADIAFVQDLSSPFEGIIAPPQDLTTRAWSYNAIDIGAPDGALTVALETGSADTFELRLVTYDTLDQWTVSELGDNGTHIITDAVQAYLIVAATPEVYGGFDDVPYALSISMAATAASGASVVGTGRNDVLRGDAFSNLIDGGAGHDIAMATGNYAAGRVNADQLTQTTTLSDQGGLDTLSSVEAIGFDDGLLMLDLEDTPTGFLYRLYEAALDRTPDADGFAFWYTAMANGLTAQAVIDGFLSSTEFITNEDQLTNTAFLELLYRETLNRAPDPEGQAFWLDALSDGVERAEIFGFFSESSEHIAETSADLGAGVFLAGIGADAFSDL